MTLSPAEIEPLAQPLQDRILNVVVAEERTIRPAALSAALGLSIEEAGAELCALMAAVGSGATFSFDQGVMVFEFPKDVRQRAQAYRRRKDAWHSFQVALFWALRGLQIVTAFGLILSLCILVVAAICGMVAALVATQQQSRGGRNQLARQIQSLCFSLREMLWLYAIFGADEDGRAYDLGLASSVCCGNPFSVFYWFRARQLARRRHRWTRGWRDEIPGVTIVSRRNEWNDEPAAAEPPRRGLLSVAVEFLFGPASNRLPFSDDPTKWKLRAAVLISFKSASLAEMSAYADTPPRSLEDTDTIVAQGLRLVSHFGGAPTDGEGIHARFSFPELLSESAVAMDYAVDDNDEDGSWESLLYTKESVPSRQVVALPPYWHEARVPLTKLGRQEFWQCACLGLLNAVGVFWMVQATSVGGVLELTAGTLEHTLIRRGLLTVLQFYACLFWFLPVARLLLLLLTNRGRAVRNERRRKLVEALVEE